MQRLARPQDVATLTQLVYRDAIREFRYHPNTDMSRSNKCHILTKDLMHHLQTDRLAVRRELHMTPSGLWHYVLAHSEVAAPATPEDVLTDLTPWCFNGGERFTGYLHAPRAEVMETLRTAGASEQHIALRGLSTIVMTHTEGLLPACIHPPLTPL